MAKNKGLGKGLDALIKINVQNDEELNFGIGDNQKKQTVIAGFTELELDKIVANPNQPRKEFDQDALEHLAQSIKNFGMIQPITVAKNNEHYEIIAGERRYRAAKLLNLDKVPVIIKDLSQKEKYEISIVENIQRENLNPIEEALAYSSLIDTYQMTQEDLAVRLGKSRTALTNTIRLLNLDPQIQKWIITGKLSAGHARCILSVPDKKQHVAFANFLIHKNLSVRESEKQAKKWQEEAVISSSNPANINTTKKELEIQIAQDKLAQRLQTKVIINGSSKKGKIQIEYFSVDDLERFFEILQIDLT